MDNIFELYNKLLQDYNILMNENIDLKNKLKNYTCPKNNKIYYQKNRDQIIQKIKEYQQNDPDKIKDYNKTYYQKNKDKIILKNTEYNKNNKEKSVILIEKRKEYNKRAYEKKKLKNLQINS